MKLELREIKDRGTSEERLVLVANEDCNLGYYFIFNTRRMPENKISTSVTNPYWLPAKQVKKSDTVVVYSRKGVNSLKVNEDSTTSYFYYRNSSSPILIGDAIALLIEASNWKAEGV